MGYLIKWDISRLIEKVHMMSPDYVPPTPEESDEEVKVIDEEQKAQVEVEAETIKKATFSHRSTTFLTAANVGHIEIDNKKDIVLLARFRAHADMINSIQFVKELDKIATCGFDKNVYIFNKETLEREGSLVMGTGQQASFEMTEAEKRKYAKIWQIKIDKEP